MVELGTRDFVNHNAMLEPTELTTELGTTVCQRRARKISKILTEYQKYDRPERLTCQTPSFSRLGRTRMVQERTSLLLTSSSKRDENWEVDIPNSVLAGVCATVLDLRRQCSQTLSDPHSYVVNRGD